MITTLKKFRTPVKNIENHRVPSGLMALDTIIHGFQNGELTILGGRPGMGTTALALNIAHFNAVTKKSVLFFSLDQSSKFISKWISKPPIEISDVERLSENEVALIKEMPEVCLHIDDTQSISVIDMMEKIREYKSEHEIHLVIIDKLQLIRGTETKDDLERTIRLLKFLASSLNIPVILISSLPRELEEREGVSRPIPNDLKAYGLIERYADTVLFLFRWDYYHIKTDDSGELTYRKAEIVVAKNRSGRLATANVMFNFNYSRFGELNREYNNRNDF